MALGAVPDTVSAQRLNCHHHHHPTEEETEAWKAESVSVKRLRSRKRQPIIAFPLLERDASPLKEVSRQGTWLVIQGNTRDLITSEGLSTAPVGKELGWLTWASENVNTRNKVPGNSLLEPGIHL